MKADKIGLTEWLTVVKRSRVLYLKLKKEDVRIYDIRPGDKIRVTLEQIKKELRDDDEVPGGERDE